MTSKNKKIPIDDKFVQNMMNINQSLKKNKSNKSNEEKILNNENQENKQDLQEDDIPDETVSKIAEQKYIEREFLDKVIKYIKIDDLVRKKMEEHKEEIKVLKTDKQELEGYIIQYLQKMEEQFININGSGKLIKNESITKGALKVDTIKESLIENIQKENLITDNDKQNEFIANILNLIDTKRPRKTRTYLKRTFEKKKNKEK